MARGLVKILLCLTLLSFMRKAKAEDDSEYSYEDYDEISLANISSKAGHRLVGGRLSATDKYQFIVGWNMFGIDATAACTGSLLTPNWFLSAAHCNPVMKPNKPGHKQRVKKCVAKTKKGKSYSDGYLRLQCKTLSGGDLELKIEPQGKAWHGVDNILDRESRRMGHEVDIKLEDMTSPWLS